MKLATDLISAVNKHKGISKANKFVLKNLVVPRKLNDKYKNDLRDINYFCETSFFPGRNMATVEHRAGSVSESFIHSNNFAETVTLTFNLTNDMFIRKIFDEWQEFIMPLTNKDEIVKTNIMKYPNQYRGSFELVKLNSELESDGVKRMIRTEGGGVDYEITSGYTVKMLDAFPKQIDAMNVSYASPDALKLTVQMAFSRWIMN